MVLHTLDMATQYLSGNSNASVFQFRIYNKKDIGFEKNIPTNQLSIAQWQLYSKSPIKIYMYLHSRGFNHGHEDNIVHIQVVKVVNHLYVSK